MYANTHKILVTLIVSFLYIGISYAQPRSIGTAYSLSGCCISYEHTIGEDSFIESEIKAELGEIFANRADVPGVSASFTWNHVIRSWVSAEGNEVRMYTGPGLAIGKCKDFMMKDGAFFGLKCRFGADCSFLGRKIIISACVAPILGTHMKITDNLLEMRYYRNGLISAIVPEIGIRYMF